MLASSIMNKTHIHFLNYLFALNLVCVYFNLNYLIGIINRRTRLSHSDHDDHDDDDDHGSHDDRGSLCDL